MCYLEIFRILLNIKTCFITYIYLIDIIWSILISDPYIFENMYSAIERWSFINSTYVKLVDNIAQVFYILNDFLLPYSINYWESQLEISSNFCLLIGRIDHLYLKWGLIWLGFKSAILLLFSVCAIYSLFPFSSFSAFFLASQCFSYMQHISYTLFSWSLT